MKPMNRSWENEPVELSDDDLDSLSGGIPHFDNAFGGHEDVGRHAPSVPLLQDRPTDNPDLWF
jgi:hypothetical protein